MDTYAAPVKVHDDDDDKFNPYVDNGGTCIAIAGQGFVLIGSDTRCSDGGYQILARNLPKTYKISPKIVMAVAGMKADGDHSVKYLRTQYDEYCNKTGKEMGVSQFQRLVSVNLYRHRMFPWYTFDIVAGLDENNNGKIYSYDAIGSSTAYQYTATGSGEALAIGILDNELMPLITDDTLKNLTIDQARKIAENAIIAVTERDIKTGDRFQYQVITKDGIQDYFIELRKD